MINKLVIVGGYSAALAVPPRSEAGDEYGARPGEKFTCDWSLMGRNRPPIPSPWKPALSQDFKQSEMSFYCLLQMCHVSPTGWALVCINLFLSPGTALRGHEYMWGDAGTKGPADGAPWRPRRPARRNGDIWSGLTPGSPTIGNHAAPLNRAIRPPFSAGYSSLGQVNLPSPLPHLFGFGCGFFFF